LSSSCPTPTGFRCLAARSDDPDGHAGGLAGVVVLSPVIALKSFAHPNGFVGLPLALSVAVRPVVLAPLALRAPGTLNAGRGARARRAPRRVQRLAARVRLGT
jgi:hypothetical protein